MAAADADKDYWGYLIEHDKSPTPLLRDLLLGVANYINKNVAPWEVRCLTPNKLASFYRLVGGNYDSLFLDSPNSSIAFIYKSIGCFHSLQPDKDPFSSPSVPALTPQGYVRWQTVQILLEPEEHVPFLQAAVKRLEIRSPSTGEPFPKTLPADALPRHADPEMCKWHDSVGEKLLLEAETVPTPRGNAPNGYGSLEQASTTAGNETSPVSNASDYFHPAPRKAHDHPRAHAGSNSPTSRSHQKDAKNDGNLQPPYPNIRRHSVPDRERGEKSYDHHGSPYRSAPRSIAPEFSPDSSFTTASTRSSSPDSPRQRHHHHHHHHHDRDRRDEAKSRPNKSRSVSPNRSGHSRSPTRRPVYTDGSGRRHSAHHPYSGRDSGRQSQQPSPPARVPNTLSPPFFVPHPAGMTAPGSRPLSQHGSQPVAFHPGSSSPLPQQAGPGSIPTVQLPPQQQQQQQQFQQSPTIPVLGGPPPPGAFARGPMRTTVSHGYYRGSNGGPWRGRDAVPLAEHGGVRYANPVPGTVPKVGPAPAQGPGSMGPPPPPPPGMAANGTGGPNGSMNPDATPRSAGPYPGPAAGQGSGGERDRGRRYSGGDGLQRRTIDEMTRQRERDDMQFEMARRKGRRRSGSAGRR